MGEHGGKPLPGPPCAEGRIPYLVAKCNGYYCYCMKHINNHTHVQ